MPYPIACLFNQPRLWHKLALPSLLLASLLGGSPAATATQPSLQSMADPSEPVMTADLGDLLREINRGAQQVDRHLRQRQQEQQRQEREAARLRERQEQEAARQAAAERQRLEAQRQQQYFDSLTPEQQQAYIAEQRAREAAQAEATARVFVPLMMLFMGSGGESSAPASSNSDYILVPGHNQPAAQPAPPPVAPISPFYGNGPAY